MNFLKLLGFFFSLNVSLSACVADRIVKVDGGSAQVAYPGQFSRPPSLGENYNSWKGAKGADVGEIQLDLKRLPSKIDNSERPEFPPVYKQVWGACGQFAAVASIFTYEMNVLNGTTADSLSNRFPAHFSWNMINDASNKGSEAYHGWEVAKRLGIPNAEIYGGVTLDKIGPWPTSYAVWRNAMNHRVSGYRYTPAKTIEQLHEARGWLFDRNKPNNNNLTKGGLFALDGRMGELSKVTVTIPKGNYGEGKKIWKKWGPSGYGHGITCVGYDDNIGYDVNDDGQITNDIDINEDGKVTLADWEKGAYVVVNSWGKKFANDGKIYLLYSAMVDPTWKRGNYLGRVEVVNYTPRRTLKLKISCSNRAKLKMSVGIARDKNATEPEYSYEPEHLNGWKIFGKGKVGEVPIAGKEDHSPIEVGVDITNLYEKLSNISGAKGKDGEGRIFIKIHTEEEGEMTGEIHSCSLRSYSSEGKFVSEIPVTIESRKFGGEQKNSIKVEIVVEISLK